MIMISALFSLSQVVCKAVCTLSSRTLMVKSTLVNSYMD